VCSILDVWAYLSTYMRKRDCVHILNEILVFLADHECFDSVCRHLDIEEEELELALQSIIIDIDNDELNK